MAVYYKFKSAKDYDSISIDGHFISVANLKERIFESKHLGRGTDFDLVVTNAQTNEEYLDEAMLIPKNTSVLIRRVPGRPRMPIVTRPDEPKVEDKFEDDQPAKSNFMAADSSGFRDFEASELDDEFGNDLYATIPEMTTVQSSNTLQDSAPASKADEDSKIKAFIENSGFDWQRQSSDGFGPGRGFGRGGRGGRGFGRGGLERKTPPQGYICHRCKVPGHFIQHCPTNGDPNYDVKKVKPPTGIPKSMLVATPDGSYALPSGTSAVLKPNEAAFEREIEGLPSTRSVGDLPPEFHCPLCKEVMKDAVLTSKCCFKSFCDKCIRDYIISKSICVCGARDVLADDLLPNKTLRDTINRILESGNSSADNAGSALQVQDMESARCPQPRIQSPTQSAASKGEQMLPPRSEGTLTVRESMDGIKPSDAPQLQLQPQISEKGKITKVPDVSEATHESASVKEPASQGSARPVEEEVQQKVAAGEAGKKKKKKKKVLLPVNAPDMQWMGMHPGMDGYMGQSAFNPCWPGMQPPMDGFMGPFGGNNMPYNMGYGLGPMDMPFGNVMHPDPFGNMFPPDPFGGQGFMMPPMLPPPPQRDLAAEYGMGMNVRPPLMSREEFEARKAEVRRKREMERRVESREPPKNRDYGRGEPPKDRDYGREPPKDRDYGREPPKDRDYGREVSSSNNPPPVKSKPKPPPLSRSPSEDRYESVRDRERARERASVDRDWDRERERERDRDHDSHRRTTHSNRSERVSPSRTRRDPEVPRPTLKRKSEQHERDHNHERERDHRVPKSEQHERDLNHERDREHRTHVKSSSAKPVSADAGSLSSLDKKLKASVFSRISFPEEELSKKRKVSAEPKPKPKLKPVSKDPEAHHHKTVSSSSTANGYHHDTGKKRIAAVAVDYESSDDERHFKRKPLRYEPSPPPREDWVGVDEEDGRRHRKHR
ncbi:E3 ubiquitin ligase PQT3-like isoform X1 [Beta vulgaris subsp. vulgaris]|uniref:E3 ubiquitin ligase PQT3-like isoform X1 n=1 Tax=Beta vulgaris subsp. vulgaris TaxID=3555 RepID=UPI002036E0A7|nr:E3 ubiquitin ligase PQT3-like isoform X1 [Beta vulgaris subsp. vulgaris]